MTPSSTAEMIFWRAPDVRSIKVLVVIPGASGSGLDDDSAVAIVAHFPLRLICATPGPRSREPLPRSTTKSFGSMQSGAVWHMDLSVTTTRDPSPDTLGDSTPSPV